MNTPAKTPNPPARYGLGFLRTAALLTSTVCSAIAQTAPAPVPKPSADEETFVLSPFTVSSEKDVGFVAASSLAGGRMATALKDTPVAYSVQTSEFLEAFNLTDVSAAADWTVNSNLSEGDGTYKVFGTTAVGQVAVRGIKVNNPTTNYFPTAFTGDSYNLDRIDYARGPNAVLFGAGGIGATVNSVTKAATTGKEIRQVQVMVGSYDRYRFTADVNAPFADKKAAVRANVVWEDADTWRQYEWTKKAGIALSGTYKLSPNLSIRADAEYLQRYEKRALASLKESLSGWDGKTSTSFGTLGAPVITGTNTLTTALTAANRATYGLGSGGSANGLSGTVGQRFVTSTLFNTPDELMNMQRYLYTSPANQNATVSSSGEINGVPIITTGLNFGDRAMIDDDGLPDRYTRALGGSPYFSLPSRNTTPLWANNNIPTYTERAKNATLTLNYNLGDNLFFEFAGNVNHVEVGANTTPRRQLEVEFIDINRNLPNGSVNPGFLHPYVEYLEYRNPRYYETAGFHVQGVYKKDTPLGKLQFSVIGGADNEMTRFRARTLILPIKHTLASGALPTGGATLDGRTWLDTTNNQFSEWGVWNRMYLDQTNRTVVDPSLTSYKVTNGISGITENVTPTWMYDATRPDNNRDALKKYQFYQTAGNLDLIKNRLVLIGAFRRDFSFISEDRLINPADMPAGWDGNSLAFRGNAPKDYNALMYYPKDATGKITGPLTPADARPRAVVNGVSLPLAQYAGDRFRDDFNAPVLHPNINTYTMGGVLNITKSLGAYANVSQSFSLLTAQPTVDGSLLPPTASQGKDFGLRFTLPSGRLSVSAGRFLSHQSGAGALLPGTFAPDYNGIYDLAPLGPTAATDATLRNARNIADFPTNVYDTSTSESKGWEFEVTANPLPGLRVTANAGYTDTYDHDKNPRMVAYFASADATARAILKDGGIAIDPVTNIATVQPIYTQPTAVGYNPALANNTTKSNTAAADWNNLQTSLIPNNPAASIYQPRLGVSKLSGNVATDYTFQSGPLKQLRVGLGVKMRSGQVVGYRGSDTIDDPKNPGAAIDDPRVDASTPVVAKGYYSTTASLHYQFRLKNRHLVQLDLYIDNLTNAGDVIYGNNGLSNTSATLFAPRNGQITDPARITIPGAFSYRTPRSFSFAAKLDF